MKNKYNLNLKVRQHDQKVYLVLNTNGLKLISRQGKSIFTTGCFNDTFLVKATPMKIFFMLPLEVQNKRKLTNFHPYAPAIKYVQRDNSTCCLSSLEYDLLDSRESFEEQAIVL